MLFTRRNTQSDIPIEDQIKWKTVESKIIASDGKVIFEMKNVEVPEHWSETATNILAQKYFRKAGVPNSLTQSIMDDGIPNWLKLSNPDNVNNTHYTETSETSAKQVFHRLAGCWTYWGWKMGIFNSSTNDFNSTTPDRVLTENNARIFYDEIYWMLANQWAAPNSPQWFNTGLFWAYGIAGPASGQWAINWDKYSSDPNSPVIFEVPDAYSRPQPHACFIQPVKDDLVNPGGIMDLFTREVRLFKLGSGTGTNFSTIRAKGEKISGGGESSGLMSFLKIGDQSAGSIKSGGTTRRAAKMVILDVDHPEILDFIDWKMLEEQKARKLVEQGYSIEEANETISGQNSNNSVRISDDFIGKVNNNAQIRFVNRVDETYSPEVCSAEHLWNRLCTAAHACGDPGVQFSDTINSWHTCSSDGEIRASNPCSEFYFLDNTACNLASINLVKFHHGKDSFDYSSFEYAVRLWTIVLDISNQMASTPSREIALGTYNYRTLGLGYANLGGLLMRQGLAYDSDEGRNLAAQITALLQGMAYKTSQEISQELGSFPRWKQNKSSMEKVIDKHYQATLLIAAGNDIGRRALGYWQGLLKAESFRNAQVTVLAPTGTIALLMDCDTTGIEPDFALVKIKQLAGGGEMRIVNQSVYGGLFTLGYTSSQATEIVKHIESTGSIHGLPTRNGEPFIHPDHLAVFACANEISPEAHVKMVAAVQPFISGGISKTINMPNDATVEDVSKVYRFAYTSGCKSISIFRDGCKIFQPLSSVKVEIKKVTAFQIEKIIPNRSSRHILPAVRRGYRHKMVVGGMTLFHSTGEYPDGTLGEIFENLGREGSTLRSVLECWAKMVSIALQYGVPLEEIVKSFLNVQFEPCGVVTDHEYIKMCSSIVDLIVRDLGINYLGQSELGQIQNYTKDEQAITELMKTFDRVLGDTCPECGGLMRQTGTCKTCSNCQFNEGCS